MNIYTTLQIGAFHTNHCEDFLITEQISSHHKLIAVLDGCTMGTESVFASMLYGKILRKIAKSTFYKEFVTNKTLDLKTTLKEVLKEVMKETVVIKNQLGLEINELLATLILGIIDTTSHATECITIGDGLIYIDGNTYEYEQNDKPDYLGYHLYDDFDTWYDHQQQKLSIPNFKDMSFCTDGIFTFKHLENKEKQKPVSEIIEYVLQDTEHMEYDTLLDRKIRHLKNQWKHVVTDDLAIIRIINTP